MKDSKIGSKEPGSFLSREPIDSRMPNILVPKPGQYPLLYDNGPCGYPSSAQPFPSTESEKCLEFLHASTAKSPSQKRKNEPKVSVPDSVKIDNFEKEEPEDGKEQQYDDDISVPSKDNLEKGKQKRRKKKQKINLEEEEVRAAADQDQSEPQATSTPASGRYQHQVKVDNVHEWISRIGRSTSPIPYISPNKRVILIPEPSTDDLHAKNEESSGDPDPVDVPSEDTKREKQANVEKCTNEILETDVEIPVDIKEKSTSLLKTSPTSPTPPTFLTPISESLNAPPKDAFFDDQSHWRKNRKETKRLETRNDWQKNGEEVKLSHKLFWNPPDKRAEARLSRALESSWLYETPSVQSRLSSGREDQSTDDVRQTFQQPFPMHYTSQGINLKQSYYI
uniref:Uncharacterized protein n=1 Tax=Setaria digitata TaxID=48799 RepID=A0A915Q027_9BILA